jgi:hypothetical protein
MLTSIKAGSPNRVCPDLSEADMRNQALTQGFSIKTNFTRAVATLAMAGILGAASTQAAHADQRWDPGAAAIVGVIGGLALGSALSGGGRGSVGYSYGYSEPRYDGWHHRHHGYRGPSVSYYWGPPQPQCYIVNERVWVRGWGWDIRPVRYCD